MALALQLLRQRDPWARSPGLAPMLLIFVIFYVVLMLPMQRQRKALQQLIENLKKGDRVVTTRRPLRRGRPRSKGRR